MTIVQKVKDTVKDVSERIDKEKVLAVSNGVLGVAVACFAFAIAMRDSTQTEQAESTDEEANDKEDNDNVIV